MTGLVGPAMPGAMRMPLYRRAPESQVETADLPRILWHRRWWIAAITTAFVAAAVVYSLLTPWLYTATAQILVDPRDKVVVTNDVNPSTVSPDGGVAQVESQVRVIESTSVLLRAIKAVDLASDPDFGAKRSGLLGRLANLLNKPADDGSWNGIDDATQRALINLRKRLTVKRADKVFVIDLSVSARSPDKAARITNAIAQAYLDDQAASRTDAAVAASGALAARLAEQKKQVNDAEDAVERYKADHGLVAANGVLVGDQQLADITTQLDTARTRAAETHARLDQIQAARNAGGHDDATAEALGSTVMTALRAREAALVEQEAQLKMQLGPRHPSVLAIDAQHRDIQRLIDAELGRIVRAARADDDRAQANVTALQGRLATLTSQSLGAKQASIRLRELERDLDASRTVYNQFLLRTQETREQASIDSSNARVITEALPPRERSWPLIGYLVAGALCAGLGLGCTIAFAAAYLAPVVLSAPQLRDALDLPVTIVALPALRRGRARTRRPRAEPARASGEPAEPQTEPPQRMALPAHRPAEAPTRPSALDDVALDFVLRRVVEATPAVRGGNRVFSVVLTCSRGSEARSADLAQALAAAADSIGDRVLLVDATAGDGGATLGLLDVLRGDADLDMVIRRKPPSGIAVLDKGTQLAGIADLRAARSADRLYAQAGRQFDIMVIDGGVAGDSIRLAPLMAGADEVLLVAERGVTSQRDAVEAADALLDMGCNASRALLVEDKLVA